MKRSRLVNDFLAFTMRIRTMDASQRGVLLNKLADLIARDKVYLTVSILLYRPFVYTRPDEMCY